MNAQTLKELQTAQTLGELLKVIERNYQVETTKISPIVRGTIITGLQMAVKMTNCKPKWAFTNIIKTSQRGRKALP